MKQPTEEMTGKVLWHVTMSLDGFIAGPDDGMDWIARFADPNPVVDQVIQTTGAVLSGRRSYNVGRKPGLPPEYRKVFGGAWNGPVFVLTHHAPDDEEDATITFLSGDIRSAVATGLRAAEGKNLLIIGASLAHQCIEAGLIDEILVQGSAYPILLFVREAFSDGKRTLPVLLHRVVWSLVAPLVRLWIQRTRKPDVITDRAAFEQGQGLRRPAIARQWAKLRVGVLYAARAAEAASAIARQVVAVVAETAANTEAILSSASAVEGSRAGTRPCQVC